MAIKSSVGTEEEVRAGTGADADMGIRTGREQEHERNCLERWL